MSKITKYSVGCLLGIMFILLFTSAWDDSATMDELAHIPSGYSYLSQKDFRLNPEHPPLIKDLSALPLLFLNLNFPLNVPAWTTDINGQWDMGRIFLYESGNDADKMLRFSRFPIMLLALLFGWLFFKWTRGLYGEKVAFLALFFFAFSPTFLAHSRYVTTDIAAAFGFFIGIAAFLNFLFRGTRKSLIIAGIAFGIAQLLKFSLVILAPLYLVLGVLWIFLNNYENFSPSSRASWKKFIKEKFAIIGKIILIGLIGIAIIWPVYLFHVWNYPVERQVADTTFILNSFGIRPLVDLTIWLSGMPVLRAMGQYILGILMVIQRASGGNTTYFMGEISAAGWSTYFPILYFLKEHLAFHILTFLALIFGIRNIIKTREKNLKNIFGWMRENFALTASFIFIIIYWTQAITSPLNIGVRHVLPTFPFIYLLVSRQTIRWIKDYSVDTPRTIFENIKNLYHQYIKPAKRGLFIFILLLWIFLSSIINFPHYVSYYNELAGRTPNGYKIATDSNYDWGQDLKRLKSWVNEYNQNCQRSSKLVGSCSHLSQNKPIEKIAIDYFGGGNPQYYFGDKFVPWWSSKGSPADQGIEWMAVSLTFLQGAHAKPAKNFTQKTEDTYPYLKNKAPVARAGTSIFIYKF
ncbi:ArnT family glycosyltransferase [Patescibacteria group bacterium]